MSKDTQSFAAGFYFLIGGSAVLGLGALGGIGVGGYYLGQAIGLAGMSATGAGVGIILGGLLVLTGIGFGIYGIVDACIRKHAANKAKREVTLQEFDTIRSDEIYNSTKNILRSTSASKMQLEGDSVKQIEQPQVVSSAAPPVKQSFWSRLFGRRSAVPACSPDDALSHPGVKYRSA